MNKFFEKYNFSLDVEKNGRSLEILSSGLESLMTPAKLRTCFSLMDLTTLRANDTAASVRALVEKVNSLETACPDYPLPASVCVYPNFASVVRDAREDANLHVTTVAGCFPSSQSFISVKAKECAMAVEAGADEVDIVLALNYFLAGDFDAAEAEIVEMRKAIDEAGAKVGRKVILKVILETGLLSTGENVATASLLAMEAGADFIKTSTGKVEVNATPAAALVMCQAIAAYYAKTGRKVGFKAAGGISNAKDAICYYSIVENVLGEEWLNKNLFRFGVSRLGNSLMSGIEQKTISFF